MPLSFDGAAMLGDHGCAAVTLFDQRLQGSSDSVLLDVRRRENRVLMTLDVGLADIRAYQPKDYPG